MSLERGAGITLIRPFTEIGTVQALLYDYIKQQVIKYKYCTASKDQVIFTFPKTSLKIIII